VVFPEMDFKEAFSRENIHGQAAVPKCDAELELGLPLQKELVALDGDF
jgi:hypothetical protein